MGLIVSDDQVRQLLRYVEILMKWNKVYNLTAITDVKEVLLYHILDGLTVIDYLQKAQSILDVGSGMGVPGVIIAISCPNKHVSVVDCSHKKAAFLQQVAIELKLHNLQVICRKIEDYTPERAYDLAISRAFSSSKLFIDKTKHLQIDTLMLMKSINVRNEMDHVLDYSHNLIELKLPSSNDKRYLLKIDVKCRKI